VASPGTAFAVSWTATLGVRPTGSGRPRLGGLPVRPATVPIATGDTWGPAAASAVARLAPAVLTVLGAAPCLVLSPARLDPGPRAFGRALAAADAPATDPRLVPVAGTPATLVGLAPAGVVGGRTRDGGGP
jgi:hypothetical protein